MGGALAGAGCSDATSSSDPTGIELQSSSSNARAVTAGLPFAASPLTVLAYRSERTVEVYDRSVQPATFVAYREEFTSDGQGRYSITPLQALTAVEPDWDLFQLFLRGQEGFTQRYRDFAVRDANLFATQYQLEDLGLQEIVAGRTCDRYRATRQIGSVLSYELSVDAATGLILSFEERDAQGQILKRVRSDTFEVNPDLSGAVWHSPRNQETVLSKPSNLSGQLGQAVAQPRLLPAGFVLHEAATVVDGEGTSWLKLTYVDGVKPLFFLYRLEPDVQAITTTTGRPLQSGTAPDLPELRFFRVGSVLMGETEIDGKDYQAVGEVSEDELADLIESALP